MTKVQIFDPAMCCSTGVCGPSVDPELTRIASAIFQLGKKGFSIERFNLANDPGAFVENNKVNKLLHEKGTDCLPVVILNGEVVKETSYPTTEELAKWYSIEETELVEKKPVMPLQFIQIDNK